MQEHLPLILAGMLMACAPAGPENDGAMAVREVRVAQITAGYPQQKKDSAKPQHIRFTPPHPRKSATETERDRLDGKSEPVKFTPPPRKSGSEVKGSKSKDQPKVIFTPPVIKKDKSEEVVTKDPITGEKVVYTPRDIKKDARQEKATDVAFVMEESRSERKLRVKTDKAGNTRVFDENGKDVTAQVPPPPLPAPQKKPAAKPKSGIADPKDEHNREIPPPPPPVQLKKKTTAVRKVKVVNEATGEAKLYDEHNREITETVSPKTKKVKIVKDASGGAKVLDENGKEVQQVPPLPPPAQPKKSAGKGTPDAR